MSKVITDYYIGSQYLHHTPEKRFLQALLQVYSKEHNWFQLNITEVAGFRKEYSVSLESTIYKEVSASHRFFENNVANAVLNTPILYQFKKELFNTIRFELHRRKSGRETFDPNNTTGDHYDDNSDFDIDFD